MTALRVVALSLVAASAAGCGPSRPRADLDRGRRAVAAALDNWKANEPPARLKALPDPVEFSEEWRAAHKLVDYTVLKTDGSDPEVIRVTVNLELQDRNGKRSEREAVYSVALKSPMVVARDPYF